MKEDEYIELEEIREEGWLGQLTWSNQHILYQNQEKILQAIKLLAQK